jgi:lysylphosphatidylglycerol synthetase-like protein (DUF2156 family)
LKKPPDAYAAIVADLECSRRAKRAHFLPALTLAAITVAGTLVTMSVRPDLWQQPPAQLAMQAVLWVLCLVVMPAIGVGLLFPGRRTRVILAIVAVATAIAATTGGPFVPHAGGHGGMDRCLTIVVGTGVLLLGIGFLSGAFVQRRRMTGVFWVAAGLSLAALNIVTWHCPQSGLMHVLPSHLGGAALLLAVAVIVGIVSHKKTRCPPSS